MTDEPNLFIDLSSGEIAQLQSMAQVRGITVDALVNEMIREQLDRYGVSEPERQELAAIRVADKTYGWEFHERLMSEADTPRARDAAE